MINSPNKKYLFGAIIFLCLALIGVVSFAQVVNYGPLPLSLRGNLRQSGAVIGKTLPNAQITLDSEYLSADENGNFIIGFDRDAPRTAALSISAPNYQPLNRVLEIAPRRYLVRNISGLPARTIDPPPETIARIEREAAIKKQKWQSNNMQTQGFLENFRWPLNSVHITSPWGAIRRLNGTMGRPHYGVDLRGARGTPIYAPASGEIILARSNFYFEGGIVAIDHGQGLISLSFHMSRVAVTEGDIVRRGQLVGAVGSTGRSTGPHLHWSLRWRGRQLDPQLMVGGLKVVE